MVPNTPQKNSANTYEIAGAGPAGLAAAIILARAGERVVVHEARPDVGWRFGGDFQGLENWTTTQDVLDELNSLGIETSGFRHESLCSGKAYDAWGRQYAIKAKKPLFYLVERGPEPGSLDHALLGQARELGVEVRFRSRLKGLQGEGILALGPRSADAIAVGYHFESDMQNGFWVICDDTLAPGGYAYLLILDGRGTVKSCMFSGFAQQHDYVRRTVAAFESLVGLEMKNPRTHGGVASLRLMETAYAGRHPVAGEQAGFQDALWGFGMRHAILSGVLAAQSLLSDEDYTRLWHNAFGRQLKTAMVNRAIFELLGNRGYRWFLRWVASSRDPHGMLRRQYRGSWFKRLLLPWAQNRMKY